MQLNLIQTRPQLPRSTEPPGKRRGLRLLRMFTLQKKLKGRIHRVLRNLRKRLKRQRCKLAKFFSGLISRFHVGVYNEVARRICSKALIGLSFPNALCQWRVRRAQVQIAFLWLSFPMLCAKVRHTARLINRNYLWLAFLFQWTVRRAYVQHAYPWLSFPNTLCQRQRNSATIIGITYRRLVNWQSQNACEEGDKDDGFKGNHFDVQLSDKWMMFGRLLWLSL